MEKKIGFIPLGRVDTAAGILRVARVAARKTHIMYRCNLTFSELKAYVVFLTNLGLVRETSKSGSSVLETTNKGAEFLHVYNTLKATLNLS